MKKIVYILVATMLAAGCNKQDYFGENLQGREMQFSACIATRATMGGMWEVGDKVGVFAYDGATSQVSNAAYNVTPATGVLSPNSNNDKIFPSAGKSLDFYAYSPFNGTQDGSSYLVDVTDQSDAEKVQANDLLWAKVENQLGEYVALQFSHQLVRLNFTLVAGGGEIIDLSGLTAKLTGANTKATFDLNTGTFSSLTEGDITLNVVVDASDNSKATITVLVAPTMILTNCSFIFTTTDGKSFVWKPANNAWMQGEKYDYTITVGKLKVKMGDYYYSDNTYSTTLDKTKTPIGVVFWVDPADTRKGKIVSLDEPVENWNGGTNSTGKLKWSTEEVYTGATS